MRKENIFIILLSLILIMVGCSSPKEKSSDSLTITKEDEKLILEYLETKTNDISRPTEGKMYSAFDILGTDVDKIYVYMLKEECFTENGEKIRTNGVVIPIVLYVNTKGEQIKIEKHKFPEDGIGYGKSIKKLFPQNVIDAISNNHNERVAKFESIIRERFNKDTEKR